MKFDAAYQQSDISLRSIIIASILASCSQIQDSGSMLYHPLLAEGGKDFIAAGLTCVNQNEDAVQG